MNPNKLNQLTNRKRAAGFTLIELMIVVLIIGILGAIAYPSYVSQVTEAKRSDGQIGLMNAVQDLEGCFTEYNAYNNANCAFNAASPKGHYAIARTVSTATTFTLQATPNASQTDPFCLNLTLTNTGVQGRTGNSPTVAECWN